MNLRSLVLLVTGWPIIKMRRMRIHSGFDLIYEVRMDAKQRVEYYKNLMTKHNNALVKPRQFNVGDLIQKKVSLATKDPTHGKLGPNWEGPYRVINSKR